MELISDEVPEEGTGSAALRCTAGAVLFQVSIQVHLSFFADQLVFKVYLDISIVQEISDERNGSLSALPVLHGSQDAKIFHKVESSLDVKEACYGEAPLAKGMFYYTQQTSPTRYCRFCFPESVLIQVERSSCEKRLSGDRSDFPWKQLFV